MFLESKCRYLESLAPHANDTQPECVRICVVQISGCWLFCLDFFCLLTFVVVVYPALVCFGSQVQRVEFTIVLILCYLFMICARSPSYVFIPLISILEWPYSYTILYKGFWYPEGEPIPHGDQWMTWIWGEPKVMRIFDYVGVNAPTPHIIWGSTIFVIQGRIVLRRKKRHFNSYYAGPQV